MFAPLEKSKDGFEISETAGKDIKHFEVALSMLPVVCISREK